MKFLSSLIITLLLTLNAIAQSTPDSTTSDTPKAEKFDFNASPKDYVISNISVVGLKTLNEKIMINTSGIMIGDSITLPGEKLALAARRLWDQRLFSDVVIETQFNHDSVAVTFLVKERARVANWVFDNIKKTQAKDLLEKLRLRRGSELSDYLMSTSMKLIREYYNEKGNRNAIVSYRLEADSLLKGAVNVIFFIEPGDKQRIKEIKIEGLEELNPRKVARAMENTKKKSINFFADTKFKDKDFPADLQLIEDYMHGQGFRDAEILEDSLYQIDSKNLGIWIKAKEGIKYYYRNITWLGNSKYTTDHLQNFVLSLKKGDTFDSETMGARLGTNGKTKQGQTSVSSLYNDNGYLVFDIKPFETVIGDSVDVEIRMVEGKQFRINSVDFEGNTRTNDHVIRRELETLPGDLYSQSLLLRTYQRLAGMGQFDQQSFSIPQVIPNPQNETVDIRYSLTEVTNDQFELSLGWGAGMFIASVGVNFTNISLRKFFDPKAWRPYPAGDNQTIGLKIQTNGTYYRALSVNFMEPWLGGRKPTQFNFSFYTSRESNAYNWGITPNKFFGTIGASVSVGKRLSWPDPFFTLQVGVQFQSYNMDNWDGFVVRNGRSNTLALNLTLARNSVDDIQAYPTMGSNISLSLALTPPFSSFDGKDYSKPMTDQERYRWIEYHKWRFNAQWFFPLSADRKLVLMTRAQFGYLGNYNKYKPSPFEGFQVGGDGLSGYNMYGVETVGMRGYSNGTLTPYTQYGIYATIFSKYTAEIRYPIIRQGSTMVYVLAFAEAGNAFLSLKEFKPFELKKAAGIGLRVFLPVLGMIGVDWGYGFDPANSSTREVSGSQFHFTMGMQM